MQNQSQQWTQVSSILKSTKNTSTACHSDGRSTDDEGNPYYMYEQAPKETPFNVYKCETCRTHHIKTKDGLFYEYAQLKESYDSAVLSTGIPQSYRYARTKEFDCDKYSNLAVAQEAKRKSINFIQYFNKFKDRGVGLYIYSPSTGAGKTLLACIIANGLVRQYNEQPRFIKTSTYFEECKKAMRSKNNEDTRGNDRIRTIENSQVLILDDLGGNKATDYTSGLLYELISKRTDLRKVTIITSKKSLEELASLKYDESTINQIRSSTRIIELPNENVGAKVSGEANKDLDELLNQV